MHFAYASAPGTIQLKKWKILCSTLIRWMRRSSILRAKAVFKCVEHTTVSIQSKTYGCQPTWGIWSRHYCIISLVNEYELCYDLYLNATEWSPPYSVNSLRNVSKWNKNIKFIGSQSLFQMSILFLDIKNNNIGRSQRNVQEKEWWRKRAPFADFPSPSLIEFIMNRELKE